MYELSWERGGSPFNYDAGVMRDRRGCVISLYSGVDSWICFFGDFSRLNFLGLDLESVFLPGTPNNHL